MRHRELVISVVSRGDLTESNGELPTADLPVFHVLSKTDIPIEAEPRARLVKVYGHTDENSNSRFVHHWHTWSIDWVKLLSSLDH